MAHALLRELLADHRWVEGAREQPWTDPRLRRSFDSVTEPIDLWGAERLIIETDVPPINTKTRDTSQNEAKYVGRALVAYALIVPAFLVATKALGVSLAVTGTLGVGFTTVLLLLIEGFKTHRGFLVGVAFYVSALLLFAELIVFARATGVSR